MEQKKEKAISIEMFITALCAIMKYWKPSKCPPVEQYHELCCSHSEEYCAACSNNGCEDYVTLKIHTVKYGGKPQNRIYTIAAIV